MNNLDCWRDIEPRELPKSHNLLQETSGQLDDFIKERYQLIQQLIAKNDIEALHKLFAINQQELVELRTQLADIGNSLCNINKLKNYTLC